MFVGHQDDERAKPEGKLPTAFDSTDSLIELFANNPRHCRLWTRQDSTPGSWENKVLLRYAAVRQLHCSRFP